MVKREYERLYGGNYSKKLREKEDELIVNGLTITSQIEGYSQLSVEGRGLYSRTTKTINYQNRSGSKVVSRRYEPRPLTIKYKLRANSSRELRKKYNKLNRLLDGQLRVSFKDEEEYEYIGVEFEDQTEEEETSNTVVRTFTLLAYDPYLYSKQQTTEAEVDIPTKYVYADEIIINFTRGTTKNPVIRLMTPDNRNENQFSLTGEYKDGDEVVIRFGGINGRVVVTGGNLGLGSLTREVKLYDGMTGEIITNSGNGNVKFKWRERLI